MAYQAEQSKLHSHI